MGRRRVSDDIPTGTPVPEPTGEIPTAEPVVTHPPNGEKRTPVKSWRLQSDRTTSIEVACWSNTIRTQAGDEYEQLSFTVQRSYKADDGWHKGGSWRVHDTPPLLYLLEKAYQYALDQRVKETTPF